MYSIGQVIRLLNEPIEGRVKAILPNGRLVVEDTHGFTRVLTEREVVPVVQSPMVVAPPGGRSAHPASMPQHTPSAERDLRSLLDSEQETVLLEFSPTSKESEAKVTLINASAWTLSVVSSRLKGDIRSGASPLLVTARSTVVIGLFDIEAISGKSGMEFQLLFFMAKDHRLREPATRSICLTKEEVRAVFEPQGPDIPSGILKPLLVLRETDHDLEKLFDKYVSKQGTALPSVTASSASSRKKLRTGKERVVDLHVESLDRDVATLSAGQIIASQLAAFEKEMDRAHLDQLDRIIFIHGIGSGILRSSIREALKHYDNVQYGDAAFERFGRGATQVDFL